jgi:hypothetical protein
MADGLQPEILFALPAQNNRPVVHMSRNIYIHGVSKQAAGLRETPSLFVLDTKVFIFDT